MTEHLKGMLKMSSWHPGLQKMKGVLLDTNLKRGWLVTKNRCFLHHSRMDGHTHTPATHTRQSANQNSRGERMTTRTHSFPLPLVDTTSTSTLRPCITPRRVLLTRDVCGCCHSAGAMTSNFKTCFKLKSKAARTSPSTNSLILTRGVNH